MELPSVTSIKIILEQRAVSLIKNHMKWLGSELYQKSVNKENLWTQKLGQHVLNQ